MTVAISGFVTDVTGRPDNSPWRFMSVLREGSDGSVITTRDQTVSPVGGVLTVQLDPGFAYVEFGEFRWGVQVPDHPGQLWDLIEAAVALPPDTTAAQITAAVASYLAANPPVASAAWADIIGKPAVIAAGATAGDARAAIGAADAASVAAGLDRANHTGVQAISTVTSLQTTLDAKQPLDATLTALAGVTTVANKLIYASGVDTFLTTDLTAAARNLLDDADAAAMRTTLGLGTAATTASTAYATAAQGALADTAVQPGLTSSAGLGFVVDEDTMGAGSGSDTKVPTQQSVKAYVQDGFVSFNASMTTELNGKEPTITAGTTSQYWRGDKSWQTLNADAVPDGTTNKAYTATEKTKLSGIATGATANDTDANLKNRANHTGSQAISTITSLQTTLDAKAAISGSATGLWMGTTLPGSGTAGVLYVVTP